MIEWVIIEDWSLTPGKEFFVCVESLEGFRYVRHAKVTGEKLYVDSYPGYFSTKSEFKHIRGDVHSGKCKITHAAQINYPEPKTLFQKFEGRAKGVEVYMLEDLVRIAQVHYEDKQCK
jgi:hypothetical protein